MATSSYRFGPSFLRSLSLPSRAYDFRTDAFSIKAWVKTFTEGPLVARNFRPGGDESGGFCLSVGFRKLTFTVGDTNFVYDVTGPGEGVCDGEWHRVAAVRRQGTAPMAISYLDGVEAKPKESSNLIGGFTFDTSEESNGTLTIGMAGPQFLKGYLAEVRLWSIERTAKDILQNFHRRLSPAETANTASKLVGH